MDARSALEAMEAIRATVPASELANLDAEYANRRSAFAPALLLSGQVLKP
jgi:hypothetical protein